MRKEAIPGRGGRKKKFSTTRGGAPGGGASSRNPRGGGGGCRAKAPAILFRSQGRGGRLRGQFCGSAVECRKKGAAGGGGPGFLTGGRHETIGGRARGGGEFGGLKIQCGQKKKPGLRYESPLWQIMLPGGENFWGGGGPARGWVPQVHLGFFSCCGGDHAVGSAGPGDARGGSMGGGAGRASGHQGGGGGPPPIFLGGWGGGGKNPGVDRVYLFLVCFYGAGAAPRGNRKKKN